MSQRIRDHLRTNVVGYIALFCFAMSGTALATHPGGANTISSGDIINEEVKSLDLAENAVKQIDIDAGAVSLPKMKANSVNSSKVVNDSLTGDDVSDDSLTDADTSGLVPYGDILWAVVNADGTMDRSSNDVATSTLEAAGTGDYEVDFGGRNLDPCATVAQISDSGIEFGELPGEAATAQGEDLESTIDVRTFDSAGAAADRGFTVHVLCPEETPPLAKGARR